MVRYNGPNKAEWDGSVEALEFITSHLPHPNGSVYQRIEEEVMTQLRNGAGAACTKDEAIEAQAMAKRALQELLESEEFARPAEGLYELFYEHSLEGRSAGRALAQRQKHLSQETNTPARKLFDKLIEATCDACIKNLDGLPGFRNWFFKRVRSDSLVTESRLAELERALGRDSVALLRFESYYCQELLKQLDVVQLFVEHTPLQEVDKKQKLRAAYIRLNLRATKQQTQTLPSVAASDLLESAKTRGARVLILGGAGSGKTTLLRWYGLEAASQTFASHRSVQPVDNPQAGHCDVDDAPWKEQIPIFVQLRYLQNLPNPTLKDLFQGIFLDEELPLSWIQSVLKSGRALLLIDGLDELTGPRRDHAVEWIKDRLCGYHEANTIVVSSRPQAVPPDVLEAAGFTEYRINDLGHDARIECAKAWHRAVSLELTGKEELSEPLLQKQARIEKALQGTGAVPRLASNPLFCALLCALNRSSEGEMPSSLGVLCDLVVQMLLWDRDAKQDIDKNQDAGKYRDSSHADRRRAVRKLADAMLDQNVDYLAREKADQTLSESLFLPLPEHGKEIDQFLKGLVLRSNLIRFCRENDVEFTHNTIRDHLGANGIQARTTARNLYKHLHSRDRARWEPVVFFAALQKDKEDYAWDLVRLLLSPPRRKSVPFEDKRLAIRILKELGMSAPKDVQDLIDQITPEGMKAPGAIEGREHKPTSLEELEFMAMIDEALLIDCHRRIDLPPMLTGEFIRMIATSDLEPTRAYLEHLRRDSTDNETLMALVEHLGAAWFAEARNLLEIPYLLARLFVGVLSPDLINLVCDLKPIQAYMEIGGPSTLRISGSQVTDLTPIQNLTRLQDLDLSHTPVIDLTPLQNLTRLLTLNLSDTPVIDLTPLQNLPQLRRLDISGTQIRGLTPLKDFSRLAWLRLSRTPITHLTPIRNLIHLRRLDISETQITDLSPLQDLNQLEWLDITLTPITDLTPIQHLSNLRLISITESYVDHRDIERIRSILPDCIIHIHSPFRQLRSPFACWRTETEIAMKTGAIGPEIREDVLPLE